MLAYSQSAPPLSPAARAQLVASLCERKKQREAMNAAASAAAKAKWVSELAELRTKSPPMLPLPVLLSVPKQSITTPVFAADTSPMLSHVMESNSVVTPSAEVAIEAAKATTATTSPTLEDSKIEVVDEVVGVLNETNNNAFVIKKEDSDNDIDGKENIPGEKSGVIRPNLIDGIAKFWDKMQSMMRERARKDTEKLKKIGESPETVGGVMGAVVTVLSLKK